MKLVQKIAIAGLLAGVLGASPAQAANAQFGFTQEFLNVCNASSPSYDAGKQSFRDNGWNLSGVEMKAALTPTFFLNEVKDYEAYEVTLDNGGTWYGTYARGNLSGFNVHMCNLWLITDNIAGVRQDLAQAIGRTNPQLVDSSGENRYIYAESNDDIIYFAQEGLEEDGITTIVLAKVYEGK